MKELKIYFSFTATQKYFKNINYCMEEDPLSICYCGWGYNRPMIRCCHCKHWYHYDWYVIVQNFIILVWMWQEGYWTMQNIGIASSVLIINQSLKVFCIIRDFLFRWRWNLWFSSWFETAARNEQGNKKRSWKNAFLI